MITNQEKGSNKIHSAPIMKNLPKAMGDISKMITGGGGAGLTDSPTFKMSMKEYEDMGIKVGDKVSIEIKKSDTGIYT
jgi:hypothetical protein